MSRRVFSVAKCGRTDCVIRTTHHCEKCGGYACTKHMPFHPCAQWQREAANSAALRKGGK